MIHLLREQASMTTQDDCHAIADLPLVVLAFTNILDDSWPLISTSLDKQTAGSYLPVAKWHPATPRIQQRLNCGPTRLGTCRVQVPRLDRHYEE
jgi:hypothetical protein